VGKPKQEYISVAVPEEEFDAIRKVVTPEEMEQLVFTDDKQTREKNMAM
jgi:polyribonucleotide nucleotidyltransferase